MVPVSRRSLREKRAAAPPLPSMQTGTRERTQTGAIRRPVVRPPASVRATRGVNQAGELTDIQRAVRQANTSAEGIPIGDVGEASSPTSWGSAVDIPITSAVDTTPPAAPATDADSAPSATPAPGPRPRADAPGITDAAQAGAGPTRSAPSADPAAASADSSHSAGSAPSAASAQGTEEPDEGAFVMRPRWESLQSVADTAEQTAVRPQHRPPTRVSARVAGHGTPPAQSPPPALSPTEVTGPEPDHDAELLDEEARKTPAWLFALQMVVLVLVVAVLGVLVYLFATGDLFGDNDGAVAIALTQAMPPDPAGP